MADREDSSPNRYPLLDRERVFDFLIEQPTRQELVDTATGIILYLEDISVSFDGFRVLNDLTLYIGSGGIALHHRAKRRW